MSESGRKRKFIQAAGLLLIGAALGFGLSVVGPRSLDWRHPKSTTEKSEPAGMTEPGVTTLEDLRAARDGSLVLIDARPYLFFKRGHIPGAINLEKEYYIRDFSRHESELKAAGDKQVVVYCSSAQCEDAAFVAGKLLGTGLKRVYVFPGGWQEWQNAKLPEAHE